MTHLRHFFRNLGFAAIAILVIWVFYGGQLLLWTTQIPGSGEDGTKNFYTVEYHIKHDQNLMWFSGMNYPDGDHVVYTDNQPFISNILKLLGGSAHWLPFLVLVSLLIGVLVYLFLLQEMGVSYWLSGFLAIGIMLLSPQLLRLGGHYSLAYVGLIPVFLFLLYENHKDPTKWRLAVIMGFVFISAFIHPYFMMMLAMLWGCFLMLELLISADRKLWKKWVIVIGKTLSPIVLFQLVMLMTDPVGDRPTNPYGFMFYRATWPSIFLPLEFDYFKDFGKSFDQSTEGSFYIGLMAVSGAIISVVIAIRNRNWKIESFHHKLLIASIPLLLLAVAFPFYIWKLERLVEYIGPFRQFRGIGRFSFVFFYAINLFAAIEIGRLAGKLEGTKKYVAGILVILVLISEAWGVRLQVLTKTMSGSQLLHNPNWSDAISQYSRETHQCIIPIPYFHVGSENFRTPEVDGMAEQAFSLSLETGIPLQSVQMSRTSLSQTLEHFQFHTYLADVPKTILDGKYNNLPLLILVKRGEPLNVEQQKLIDHSKPLARNGQFELRELELTAFAEIPRENVMQIKADSAETSTTGPLDGMYYYSFDDMESQRAFVKPGALGVDRIAWTEIIHQGFRLKDTTDHELSFWFYAGAQHAVNTQLWFWERSDGEEVRFEVTEIGDHIAQVMGDWILVSFPISLAHKDNTFQLIAHRDGDNMKIWFDELMIRPVNRHYFKPGPLNLDNRYMESPLN
ncbi:MAG: hypothetical protein R2813_06235 [Flavobacteriales bacterium]